MPLTAPQLAPVVMAANTAVAAAPKRTSLPSMLGMGVTCSACCSAGTGWVSAT